MERVKRLQSQNVRVRDIPPPALSVKKPNPLEHSLDSQKIAIGIGLGPSGQELALAATDLDFQRTRKIELKRLAGVAYPNYSHSFSSA